MPVEFLDGRRLAVPRDVIVGGDEQIPNRDQRPLDEVRLMRRMEADRHVGLAPRQVDIVIGEHQRHLDIGIKLDEVPHLAREPGRAEADASW